MNRVLKWLPVKIKIFEVILLLIKDLLTTIGGNCRMSARPQVDSKIKKECLVATAYCVDTWFCLKGDWKPRL